MTWCTSSLCTLTLNLLNEYYHLQIIDVHGAHVELTGQFA
jgi:hypothetical protein